MKSFALVSATCLALVSIGAACGSSGDSNFGEGSNNATGNDAGTGASSSSTGGPLIGSGTSSSSSSSGDPQPIDDGGACAAKSADASRKPAYLFFVLDQSASMAESACLLENASQCLNNNGTPKAGAPACCADKEKPKRWTPITKALDAFVNDPLSKGITAGLELFPSDHDNDKFCNAATYASDVTKMDVPMTALPDPTKTTFKSKFVDTPDFLGTPTRAVLKAIGPIAQKWAADHPDAKTAIVLLTDGLPQQCGDTDNNIDNVAGELSKLTIPTYVIGVSDKPENIADLQKLAAAGKTTLTRVDTTDPAKTQKEFLDRINEIRKSTLSCEVSLPAPPDGQTLDLNKVNVTFTAGNKTKTALTYDAECKGTGQSWHFDSLAQATKIELCAATCDVFEADPDGVVSVEFGCARRDDNVVK